MEEEAMNNLTGIAWTILYLVSLPIALALGLILYDLVRNFTKGKTS